MRLGLVIKEYRFKNKMSMRDFADKSGLSKAYISMLESNKNSRDGKPIAPSVKTLQKVSNALKISLSELLVLLGDEVIDISQDNLNDEQAEVLAEYQKLPPDSQKLVMGIMKQINLQGKPRAKGVVQNINGYTNYVAGRDQIVNQDGG